MANYAYYVFFDALSSHTNYKSKREFRKYENRQKPIIFGKKWPNQGDNMRIIVMQLSKKNYFNDIRTIFHRYFSLGYQI